MKKFIVSLIALLTLALPAVAQTHSEGFGEELYGRHKNTSGIKPHFEVNAGFITAGKLSTKSDGKISTNLSRPYIDAIIGARFNKYISLGVGVGVQYAYGQSKLMNLGTGDFSETWGAVCIPIYGNVKAHYPIDDLFAPYISVSIGGNVIATSNFERDGYGEVKGGLMMKFGAGLSISKFHLGLGLATQSLEWISEAGVTNFKGGNNAFYIEAGVMF